MDNDVSVELLCDNSAAETADEDKNRPARNLRALFSSVM